eukprot:Phypoly_transcript_17208.p1 GENE.Phypoly_transcript_17208~~Phypoly_transcript_17208.p1  ORF type:complete len:212 (+),score=40.49 Phypoly_transcript_17208:138-773(+)
MPKNNTKLLPKNELTTQAKEDGKKRPRRKFDYSLDYKKLDCRSHPELYCIGKGEQGVLVVEPYKSEILPFWRFKTPDIARTSSEQIYGLFKKYKAEDDFVGMDMARKFLMMGWTRSRRYANHASGKKYSDTDKPMTKTKKEKVQEKAALSSKDFNSRNKAHKLKTLTKEIAPLEQDPVKAESAVIFREKYLKAYNDPEYQQMAKDFIAKYG